MPTSATTTPPTRPSGGSISGPQGDDAYIRLYIAQSPVFAFGFTGFKGARDDNMVAGQILFAGNMTVRAPRLQRSLYGFTK